MKIIREISECILNCHCIPEPILRHRSRLVSGALKTVVKVRGNLVDTRPTTVIICFWTKNTNQNRVSDPVKVLMFTPCSVTLFLTKGPRWTIMQSFNLMIRLNYWGEEGIVRPLIKRHYNMWSREMNIKIIYGQLVAVVWKGQALLGGRGQTLENENLERYVFYARSH